MVEISMTKAGMIYVTIVLLLAGTYYLSLSSQDEFIRDNRWTSDRSALNLVLENEVTLLYTYETEEIREKLPTEYRIGNNTFSVPIDNTDDLLVALDDFKAAVDNEKISQVQIDEYFDNIISDYIYDELRYTAAITTINLELNVEYLQKLAPNIPPIVIGTERKSIVVHGISILQGGVWKVKMLVEEDLDGNFITPDISLERYFDYEP